MTGSFRGKVRFSTTEGEGPVGKGKVSLVGEDGQVLWESEESDFQQGDSVTFGPISAGFDVEWSGQQQQAQGEQQQQAQGHQAAPVQRPQPTRPTRPR